MTVALIIALFIIIIVLAVIGIHKQAQISSLKNQINFLQINLKLLTEKEKGNTQKIEEDLDSD
jgi:predicted Holliday junction resolvase-like endonuclease